MQQVLDRPDVWRIIETLPVIDGKLNRASLHAIAGNHGIDPEIFVQAVDEKHTAGEVMEAPPVSEQEYRAAEYRAFLGPRPPRSERHDFDLLPADIQQYSEDFRRYFEQVVMIPKLRETRVLTGFSRVVPPDAGGVIAELSLKSQNWLPAMEVRGEGIFITLRSDILEEWSTKTERMTARAQIINGRLAQVAADRGTDLRTITPEFLLVHTLAHVLIRQLTFDCGYDSSSLRERIYIDGGGGNKMTGLLLYTASGDSEGTLGGLVRQGLPGRLDGTFRAAISNARLCSSDPLCNENEGQGIDGLNLAACHACTLLPETSCEEGNRLLDRGLLIGTSGNEELGLFSDVHAEG